MPVQTQREDLPTVAKKMESKIEAMASPLLTRDSSCRGKRVARTTDSRVTMGMPANRSYSYVQTSPTHWIQARSLLLSIITILLLTTGLSSRDWQSCQVDNILPVYLKPRRGPSNPSSEESCAGGL